MGEKIIVYRLIELIRKGFLRQRISTSLTTVRRNMSRFINRVPRTHDRDFYQFVRSRMYSERLGHKS
jgi:hypothetical protein